MQVGSHIFYEYMFALWLTVELPMDCARVIEQSMHSPRGGHRTTLGGRASAGAGACLLPHFARGGLVGMQATPDFVQSKAGKIRVAKIGCVVTLVCTKSVTPSPIKSAFRPPRSARFLGYRCE